MVTVSEVREKWNRRYVEKFKAGVSPEPNPLALRFQHRVRGGVMLDAACGLGAGIAALSGQVERIVAVDLSDRALRDGKAHWKDRTNISWVQADVARMEWRGPCFEVICAFGFTDWNFFRRVPGLLKKGGLFFYQGFSVRQLTVKPNLDPAWTSTPESISALFHEFEVLALESSESPPFRVSFVAAAPGSPEESQP
ncbi:MAG: class I SAM-dependent methyltransferase [bacterium]